MPGRDHDRVRRAEARPCGRITLSLVRLAKVGAMSFVGFLRRDDMRGTCIVVVAAAVMVAGCRPGEAMPHAEPKGVTARAPSRSDGRPTLVGRAILPAHAYQPGPSSGASVNFANGVTPPFPGQPIPGFSAILDAGSGTFWAMPDNGFGGKANSGDFLLRLYRIRPEFRTERGGRGTVAVLGHVQLSDPEGRIPFDLFRADRLLTGADFDLESVRVAGNGDLWFGEEFGPFLLHTDATGKVLEPPIPLPGVTSPQSPFLTDPDAWSLAPSRGFEAMALAIDGHALYPMLECRRPCKAA